MKIYKQERSLEIVGKSTMIRFELLKFYCGTKDWITGITLMIKGHLLGINFIYHNYNKDKVNIKG